MRVRTADTGLAPKSGPTADVRDMSEAGLQDRMVDIERAERGDAPDVLYQVRPPDLIAERERIVFELLKRILWDEGRHQFAPFADRFMAAWGNRPYTDTMRANLRNWYDLARRADPPWRHEMSSPDEVDRWYEGGTDPERGDDEPAITGRTLPKGTQLQQGKYVVNRVLGQGGFGITYLAEDTALRRHVAIKELFPPGCVRHTNAVVRPNFRAPLTANKFDLAKTKFLKEAQTLARFDDPGIVRVYTVFTENNTAYMVMKYLRGRTLGELLKENGGVLSEPEAVRYVDAIGQALTKLHDAGVLHRDVTPENALVTDGRPVLVDFGEAREFTADVTGSMEVGITPGYAPLELYGGASKADAYTDVYALGATLYRLVTGKVPVEAPDRVGGLRLRPPHEVNAEVSEKVSKAVMKSMAIRAADRYQTMDEFLNALASREPPRPRPPTPAAPTLTRDDGSCRASWVNVDGATGYDLRWRQRGAWTLVTDAVRPGTIAPLVRSEILDVQVRSKNRTGASAWSPIAWSAGTPASGGMMRRIAFGLALLMKRIAFVVALLAVIMIVVLSDGGGEEPFDGPREDTVPEAPPDEDDGPKSSEENAGTATPEDDGAADVPEKPAAEPAERIYPRISSLVRQDPSAYRTNADSVTWRITFTEAVTNVDARDFAVVGRTWQPTVKTVDESASVYDIVLDSSGSGLADHNGTVTLGFSRGMYIKNRDGNRVLNMNADGRYEASYVIDNAAPTVIFSPESGRIGDAGGNLILRFSEAVYSDSSRTAFTEATLAGLIDLREDDESGAPIPFAASIDPDDDTVTIDPTGVLPLRTWVRARNVYHDTVGNAGLQATATFTVDTIRPTVTIEGVPATDSGAFMATFTFSEPVTGFTASDVAVTNATASAVTEIRDGLQWFVRITPTGDYRVALPPDRVTDLAGNGNRASTPRDGSYGADVTDPRLVSIVRQTPSSSPTRADSITWRITFSEDVDRFNPDSVALLDHESEVPVSGVTESIIAMEDSKSVYDVTFFGSALAKHNGTVKLAFLTMGSPGNWVSVSVRDKSNRPLPCCDPLGADERTFDVDNVPPRVADIVRSSPGREHTNHDEVAWTVTFSEAVRNLSGGDFAISGAEAAITLTPEGSGSRTWKVVVSGGNLASLNGTIKLSFAGTRDIKDLAGNVLAAIAPTGADENTFVIDNAAPALISIARQPLDGSSPADAETATWRLTFSEDMQGIDGTDFAIHGGTIAVAAAGSQAVYDLSVSGEDVVPVRRPISAYLERESNITDLAGNALRAPRPPTTIVLPSSVAAPR